ncbi:type II and III secretion system protein family protein [Hyphococcus luteus]|nr:type II and III secretion system protein family protein [Marinicaulis flavus]
MRIFSKGAPTLAAMLLIVQPSMAEPAASQKAITLDVDAATLIELPRAAETVFIANPEIADVQVPTPARVLVYAKKPGKTTIYTLLKNGAAESYALTVQHSKQAIGAAVREQAPGADVKVTSAPRGVSVSGTVGSPVEAQIVKGAVQQHIGEDEDMAFNVGVREPTQVNLQIRVAEVSKQVDKSFGLNWNAVFNDGKFAVGLLTGREPLASAAETIGDFSRSSTGVNSLGFGYRSDSGNVDVSGLLDALQAEGLVSILAEPNLTAVSGETATFLSGGEFPVPISQGFDQVTIEWKSFGVSVAFSPVVLDRDHISIKVRPEVSELSNQGAVTIGDIQIPAITVRRAETTVELASGQSFAIAGMFLNNTMNEVSNLPGLGNLPVLGALFRSTRFQRNESELVIVVTPYIVQPARRTSDIRLPNEDLVFANDLEQILLGRLKKGGGGLRDETNDEPHLTGPAGFILEQ